MSFTKMPSKQYQNVLSFPETSQISFSKSKIYKVSVLSGSNFLRISLAICIFHCGVGANLVRVGIMNPVGWTVSANALCW